jgi:hypothetical protein
LAGFRVSLVGFAMILMVAALWLLTTGLMGPISSYLNNGKPAAEATLIRSQRAHTAASIGFIRGNLWADYALILASELPPAGANRTGSAPAIERARRAAERAVRLAPINAEVWLTLAETDLRSGWGKMSLEALKMSYYTGPNELNLIPDRLRLATQTAVSDPELQILVDHEIRTIVLSKPDLKPAIIAAYRAASSEGKRLIEDDLKDTDPGFLATIHPSDQRP